MSVPDSPTITSTIVEDVRTKLQGALAPLKLTEITKSLTRPKKVKLADFQNEVQSVLDEQVRLGFAFCHPSGKASVERYWSKDEKHLLRTKAAEFASTPQTLSQLSKSLGTIVQGVDSSFVESVLRELIGDDQLFEYPPLTKKGGPRFGAVAPPPPLPTLELPKHKKVVDKLIAETQKLLVAAKVPLDEVLNVLRERLRLPAAGESGKPATMLPPSANRGPESADQMMPPSSSELENLILKAVENAPVVSLPDLRGDMPAEFRGRAFDEAILRMAEEQRLSVHQDADPASLSEAERAGCVQDGSHVYTTITKRN